MMKNILRVARKEFLDMFRDKRTIMRMMLIPMIAFPLIMLIVTEVQSNASKKTAEKELKIGYILNDQDKVFIDSLASAAHFKYISYSDSAKMYADVKSEEIDAGLILDEEFDRKYQNNQTAHLGIIYRKADMEEFERLQTQLTKLNAFMVGKRLMENDLSPALPIAFDYSKSLSDEKNKYNVSEDKEVIGKYAGGLLPYIFIAFCFMGCMYPAIDLFAGEKERGTLETLLLTPVNRNAILIGKMIVITSFWFTQRYPCTHGLVRWY